MSAHIDISYRRIGQIAGPVLITNFSYTAMGVIDTIMVGRLGVASLGAVGLGNLVSFTLLGFFLGLLTGVNTMVAQAVGGADRVAAGRVFAQGLFLAIVSSLAITSCWPFVPAVFQWTGGSPEVQSIATDYMRIRLLGSAGFMLMLACDNFYRGLGRTAVTMRCGFAQMVLNCGLNYVLIFGNFGAPRLGAAGAALGTVLAQLAVGLFLFASIVGPTSVCREFGIRRSLRLRRVLAARLLRLSLPIGIQIGLEMGGIAVFTGLVSRLGDAALAATNAVIQAWSFAFMGAAALSVGATTLVGQCIGADQPQRSRIVVRRVMRIGYVLTAVFAVIYVSFPHRLMAIFVRASELELVLPYARPLFIVVVLCLVFDLKFNILAGALRGAGDTTYAMLVNVGSAWLVFVPALLLATPRFGLVGAWSCFVLHVALMAVLLEVRVRGRAWLRRPLYHGEESAPSDEGLDSALAADKDPVQAIGPAL